MRIVEPEQIKRRSIKSKKRSKTPFYFILLLLATTVFIGIQIKPQKITKVTQLLSTPSKTAVKNPLRTTMRNFTNQDFATFYSSFAYPNTSEIVVPPKITDNPEADKKIQTLAVARGFKLRSAPVVPPVLVDDGYYLQQKAVEPLLEMQKAAKKAGLALTLIAAFRSIDEQRDLFMSRLSATATAVAAGTADASVNETLNVTAPPGYSRHHNGFTIDLACGSVGGLAFLTTNCYKWLGDNNFANAKNYGWIPSYPQGATSVGPEPEPWEYVWVSRGALLQ